MIPILNEETLFSKFKINQQEYFSNYYAFYSSWFGGILKNPNLMLIPLDDHMVHRGDGVFEAMKTKNGAVYLIDEHLHRLFNSADKIGLTPPFSLADTKSIILQTLHAANKQDTSIRVFISRGPGNYSMNPYDSIQSQLYVVITKLVEPSPEKYQKGISIGVSNIPVKISWMAQIKSCNYLPNVLIKKEAVDRKLDFVVGIDEDSNVCEGSGENILIVDQNGILTYPPLEYILKGTTMMRLCELAQQQGIIVKERLISVGELKTAKEVILAGTTINILPVIKIEEHVIGDGRPGKVFTLLSKLINQDVEANESYPASKTI